jgi:hypothetical protein
MAYIIESHDFVIDTDLQDQVQILQFQQSQIWNPIEMESLTGEIKYKPVS